MVYLREQLDGVRVLPVLQVESEEQAVGLCRALQAGGLKGVEITLRTSAALAAISAVKKTLPDLMVAAGTVNSIRDMESVAAAGVDLAVSPGLTRLLSDCARELGMPFLPGVSTASEILGGLELGYTTFKFFPAETSGGVAALSAFGAPFQGVSFCPTGGINQENLADYLKLPNVICAGGSWMVPKDLLADRDWQAIESRARQLLEFLGQLPARES